MRVRKPLIIGAVYFKLTVIGDFRKNPVSGSSQYLCRCECGVVKYIDRLPLIIGKIKSCGCFKREIAKISICKMREILGKPSNTKYNPWISSARAIYRKSYNDGNISFDKFYELSQLNCFYCNAEKTNKNNVFKNLKTAISENKDKGEFVYNGLDRIDSENDHSTDNVVTCCWKCNFAKAHYQLINLFLI